MKFVDRRYGRSAGLPVLTAAAAALIDRRDARVIRRTPEQAAVIRAERILIANRERSS